MKQDHLNAIINKFNLDEVIDSPTALIGSRRGSTLWKINTRTKCVVVKQLALDLDMQDRRIIAQYEQSEMIAAEFSQQGTPSITAFKKDNKYLYAYDNTGYLVYPYIEGRTLQQNAVSEKHALVVAKLMAKMHSAQLPLSHLISPQYEVASSDNIVNAIKQSVKKNYSFSSILAQHQSLLIDMNDHYRSVIPILKQSLTLTHGDIRPLNIIWDDNNQPTLIDWETASIKNPTQEAVSTSIRWSGLHADSFLPSLYEKMITTYIKHGGLFDPKHIKAAVYGHHGSIINWILYYISAIDQWHEDDKEIGRIEILRAISGIKKIDRLLPYLLNIKK